MSRPRILIFSLASFPFVGGAEVALKELTTRLSDQFEFEIISADVRSFWQKYFFPFWAARRAARQHQKNKYDLIWSIMANQAGMAGAIFKRLHPEIPFLLTLQEGDDLDSFAYRIRLWGPKIFKVFQKADQVQAISHYLADWAKKMGVACPITVIPNGVDQNQFSDPVPRGGKIIITTSRLVRKNGLDDLIRALAFLPADVKLQILGSGPEEVNLRALVSHLGMAPRVSFLGQVKSSEVGQYLGRATVFVRPSRSEGLGNSFLEAMAAGLPVVGTPVGGIPDFLKSGKTGWLCRVNNPQSIAEQVLFILDPNNQTVVNQITSQARTLVKTDYDWPTLATRFNTLLKSML